MNKIFRLIVIILVLAASSSYAQKVVNSSWKKAIADSLAIVDAKEYLPMDYGIFAHYNMNMHAADFTTLPGVPNCCPKFKEGSGGAFSFGLMIAKPFSSALSLQLRAGMYNYSALLEADEKGAFDINDEAVEGVMRHEIDATISHIGIEPILSYRLFSGFSVNVGLQAGFIMQKEYSQYEEITEPKNQVVYENGDKRYLESSGDIPEASSLMLSALAGLSYELPLNKDKTLMLVPEVFYSIGLSNVVTPDTSDWSINALRAGISFKYRPAKPEEPPIRNYRVKPSIDTIRLAKKGIEKEMIKLGKKVSDIKTITDFVADFNRDVETTTERFSRTDTLFFPKAPDLIAEITAMGVGKSGAVYTDVVFNVEEYITDSRNFPLLNYIFFDENAYELPKRYKQLNSRTVKKFDDDDMDIWETLPIYYDLLNIVGKRMRKNTDAKIKLTAVSGTRSGSNDMANNRAETVKKYLVNSWKIDADRIIIKTRKVKEKSNISNEKLAENRRVEITSANPNILQPLFKASDTSRTVDPPMVRFMPEVKSEAGLANWKITAKQGERVLKEISSSGDIPDKLDWQINREKKTTPTNGQPITYTVYVKDKNGQEFTSEIRELKVKYLTIREKLGDMAGTTLVERYNLILFDLDRSEVKGNNKKIVDFIKSRIKKDSKVEITGYTDKLGNPQYNLKLSEARATSTAKALKMPGVATKGVGGEFPLFDNSLPEGRFYCRTVEVKIETPNK